MLTRTHFERVRKENRIQPGTSIYAGDGAVLAKLDILCDVLGCTRSELICELIRQEYAQHPTL